MPPSPRSRLQRFVDVAIPLVVALFLVSLVADYSGDEPAPLPLLGLLAAAAQGAALWWRRSHPVLVMAIALAGGLVVQLLAPEGVFAWAGLVAIGSLAAARPPRCRSRRSPCSLGLTALNFFTATAEDTLFAMGFTVIPWALGEAARNRRRAIDQESRRAVSEEQARIARELHDVFAHSVSVIVVQAAAAGDVFDERPGPGARRAALDRGGRAARRSASCAGCSPPSSPTRRASRSSRSPGSPGSGSSPRRCAPPASTSRCGARAAARSRCPRGSTSPPTGSSRRRSRTRCATPARAAPR